MSGNICGNSGQGSLQTVIDNQTLDNIKRSIKLKKESYSWLPTREEIPYIFNLALRTDRMGEITRLLDDNVNECLEILLETSNEELLNKVFENMEWIKVFVLNPVPYWEVL